MNPSDKGANAPSDHSHAQFSMHIQCVNFFGRNILKFTEHFLLWQPDHMPHARTVNMKFPVKSGLSLEKLSIQHFSAEILSRKFFNNQAFYQTNGISRYRTLAEYCRYPSNSFCSVLSSRIVLATNRMTRALAGRMLHTEPKSNGNPVACIIDPR